MDHLIYIAAVLIPVIEIISHRDIRQRLAKNHPEVSERDYYPQDYLMFVLLVVGIVSLILKLTGK